MKSKSDIKLPKGILKKDVTRPNHKNWDPKDPVLWDSNLKMFYTKRFGWVIVTLLIKKASRRARARGVDSDRYYGVDLRGNLVTVGHGPHVLREVEVYVRKSRVEKLKKYLDLKETGAEMAHDARDRRSSRAAATRRRRRNMWDDPF